MRRPGPLLITSTFVLLTLIWGTTWAAIRIAVRDLPPITGVALRFTIAAALLLPLGRAMGVRYGKKPYEIRLWIINGVLSFCISYGVVFWAEQWAPSGLAAILFATFPLFTAILAHFTLANERLTGLALVGILIGFAGIATIFSEDFAVLGGPMVATAAAVLLISPAVSAVANISVKRWGSGIHPISLTAVPMAIAAVVMGAIALGVEQGRPVNFNATSIAALLYMAIFGSAVTFTLYYWLLRYMTATRLALIAYTAPVVALILGAVFLDEPITIRTIAGSVLVIGGVALTVRAPQKKRPDAEPDAAEGQSR